MRYDLQCIENILDLRTLSGIDAYKIDSCEKSGFLIYFECWSYESYDAITEKCTHEEMLEILNSMDEYNDVGDFICDEIAQRIEFAAYLLILLDRYARMALEAFDPWKAFALFHQIYECYHYVSPPRFILRGNAQKAASARHAENRAMRQQAFEWYRDHGSSLKNDDAAIEMTKLVPIRLRTAQDWITGFRKQLRSARTT